MTEQEMIQKVGGIIEEQASETLKEMLELIDPNDIELFGVRCLIVSELMKRGV